MTPSASLSQTNPSPNALPGVPEEVPLRLHLLYLILHGIHTSSSSGFVLSVKVNCSDFVQGGELYMLLRSRPSSRAGLDEEQAADIVKQIVSWGIVDVLEVSGGTYASPGTQSLEARRCPSDSQRSPPPRLSASPHPPPPVNPSSPISQHPSYLTCRLLRWDPQYYSPAVYTTDPSSRPRSEIEHATLSG
jgi:hypothetical protein